MCLTKGGDVSRIVAIIETAPRPTWWCNGGQVRLPWQGALVVPSVFGFEQGWYSQGSTRMYVNRGLGTLPIRARFGCRPEVCELTLLPA